MSGYEPVHPGVAGEAGSAPLAGRERAAGRPAYSLVDSHVHLDRYPDGEVVGMLARAGAAGVGRLLTIGTDLDSSRAALRLAERFAGGTLPVVEAAVGVHPTRLRQHERPGGVICPGGAAHPSGRLVRGAADAGRSGSPSGELATPAPSQDVDASDDTAPEAARLPPEQALGALLAQTGQAPTSARPVAIGEVGLDDQAPDPAEQARFLEACFTLAAESALPLVLHVVGRPATHAAALAIARCWPAVRVVAHYFVGGPDLARAYLNADCWISVGKPVTRSGEPVQQAVSLIPPERLLLETDTYPLPGRATEPRDVVQVCAAVARLTGRAVAAVAAATSASYADFIGSRPADEFEADE